MAVSRRSAYFCIELKQFKLKNNEFNFFPTPLGFVCWWCKIYNKNVGTHKGCLQKPVDKKVHGGETLCKNRKERIIQLLRKENITGSQRIDFHLNLMKKILDKNYFNPDYRNFWCKTDQKLWKD